VPEEGKFNKQEIEHYRSVIQACRIRGVEPVVTLHHFSSPVWLIRKGGWEADTTPDDFGSRQVFFAQFPSQVTPKREDTHRSPEPESKGLG
jgi:beta-glucosidase